MKKLLLPVLLCALLALLMLALSGCHTECEPIVDAAVPATCTSEGLTEGSHCGICGEVLVAQERVPMLPHTEVVDKELPANCTKEGLTEGKHCSVCETVLVPQEVTAPLGHTVVTDKRVAATCGRTGKTEGSHCKVCRSTIVSQKEIPMLPHTYVDDCCTACGVYNLSRVMPYVSYEGYAYFATAKNGTAMRNFYNYIDADLIDFHLNKSRNAGKNPLDDRYPTIAGYNYQQFGLTLDEAFTVWTYYRKDHPLYYWLAYYLSWNSSEIYLHTVLEHANGVTRAMYNRKIYEGIADYVKCAEGAETSYDIALAYYDEIISRNSYGDSAPGAPVMTEVWAHNILGAFVYNTFVCEGYSKLFQLLLNYSGVENRHVVGDNHAWNIVRMDDGKWYWFDPTWDDSSYDGACRYEWFCRTDKDFPEHTPAYATSCVGFTIYVNMTLPTRGTTAFDGFDVLEIGATFQKDGNTYQRTSYDTVKLVEITEPDKIPASRTVTFKGVTYTIA